MNRGELESLTIRSLRGYLDPFMLPFDKGKKLCIVYGENGTGKTTLCDALEALSAGTLGSLDDRGLGRPEKFWTPASGDGGGGRIELKTRSGSYSAAVEGGKVAWETSKPTVSVLRRAMLAKLITAKPAERYSAIESLVDVSGVEAAEGNLSALVKEVTREEEGQLKHLLGAQDMLRSFATSAAGPDVDPVEWARGEARQDVRHLVARRDGLQDLLGVHSRLVDRWDAYHATARDLDLLREELVTAQARAAEVAHAATMTDAALLTLLQAASHVLSAHEPMDACPLCESREQVASLSGRVAKRLAAMEQLRMARSREADVSRRIEVLQSQQSRMDTEYVVVREAFQGLRSTLPALATVPELPESLADVASWLEAARDARAAWDQAHREATSLVENVASLREALRVYDKNHADAARSAALLKALEHGHALVVARRHAFVNDLLAAVSGEVETMYERVHPGEGLNRISLRLDPKRRASLNLHTQFQSREAVPPQAYFSDSHLDTLGLCVFLALAKQRSPAATILVLDDVLGSVDEPHVDSVIEMIAAEAEHFRHVVVTTHYRPWREKLRWGFLNHGPVQLVELRWSSGGPSIVRSAAHIERLRKELSQDDRDEQIVCAKAGVVLEAALDFLTELYECKVPRKSRDGWTIGDLLPAIGRKLREKLRVERLDNSAPPTYTVHELGPLIDELSRIAQTRNLMGAHFSKLSFHLRDRDAFHFAEKVLELMDHLVDSEHRWPRSSKSGSYWATAGETRRLHPLREPA